MNGLMLGLSLRLRENPSAYGDVQPLFATVQGETGIELAVLMTPPYKLQINAAERVSDSSLDLLIEGLKSGKWEVPAVSARKDVAERFAEKWREVGKIGVRAGMAQRIHCLRQVAETRSSRGDMKQAGAAEADMAVSWFQSFHQEVFDGSEPDNSVKMANERINAGELFLWVDGKPVSLAARMRPTRNGEFVGYVYTPPEYRQNGYATSLVAALSQRILDEGKSYCTLYTDLSNPTSNSIYRKIGYVPIADVIDLYFESG
ncbi:MAG: GNAT family N-acetyltransferase [Proteobacteria bacterium]|nr:GNAT family N-acetyltransferase [Pseudomonadota bacterium]